MIREARLKILKLHVTQVPVKLNEEEWDRLVQNTEGFSGSDIATCTADAVLQPIRELELAKYWKYDKGKLVYMNCMYMATYITDNIILKYTVLYLCILLCMI